MNTVHIFKQALRVCPFFHTIIQFTHLQHPSHTRHPSGTPSIHQPISAGFPPKNGQTFFHLLLSTLSHLTVFQAFVLLIIILYHDFLPTPRRGSDVKSDKTHTPSSRFNYPICLTTEP